MLLTSSIIIGLVAFCGFAYTINKQTTQKALSEIQDEAEKESNWTPNTLPLEQKLRNAIFDCEQNVKKCINQLSEYYESQLDLVKNLGNKSHIEVKGKKFFFEYNNVLNKEHFFKNTF